MENFNNVPVYYLEDEDVDSSGNLKINPGKPIVCMIQGSFCGYCTKAKPDFTKLAVSNPDVFVCTVKIDGNPSEKKLGDRLKNLLSNYEGVPTYFGSNGVGIVEYNGGRDAASIEKFAKSLK